MLDIEVSRRAFEQRAWVKAWEALAKADAATALDAATLEQLARTAYMLGRDDDYLSGLERAHHAHLKDGDVAAAARCAWWIGHHLLFRGRAGPAAGWFARGQRLLDSSGLDCVEVGWLKLPDVIKDLSRGRDAEAAATAAATAEIAERFGDQDLRALAVMERGRALVGAGDREQGLELLDEAMVGVTTGDLSPLVAGIVYCNTLAFLARIFELARAREWTAALTAWCDAQPEMIAHNGPCRVHRAEIMTLEGAWSDALDELRDLEQHYTAGVLNERAQGDAAYRKGELHRLRGELGAAETAYADAARLGRDPLPGLALLRLRQGDLRAGVSAIERALAETTSPLERAPLLAAQVELALADADVGPAREAAYELEQIASAGTSRALMATARDAAGQVALAEGDAAAALRNLRPAWYAWQGFGATYPAAWTRVHIGLACQALGDHEAASQAFESARDVFRQLGAAWDQGRVESLLSPGHGKSSSHGLTARELEVLGLVATGSTNREVAATLFISEKTVERHVSNIFTKLGVPNRASAGAYAHDHGLL
ncbi:MAG: response regulator transcription factor [Actinobacteria bacterium]|nr:response regulator transcription factor [Actinomycetota bacterium]